MIPADASPGMKKSRLVSPILAHSKASTLMRVRADFVGRTIRRHQIRDDPLKKTPRPKDEKKPELRSVTGKR
jgi:hypothetical protein